MPAYIFPEGLTMFSLVYQHHCFLCFAYYVKKIIFFWKKLMGPPCVQASYTTAVHRAFLSAVLAGKLAMGSFLGTPGSFSFYHLMRTCLRSPGSPRNGQWYCRSASAWLGVLKTCVLSYPCAVILEDMSLYVHLWQPVVFGSVFWS